MSVFRFLPLLECEALRQVQTTETSGESCAIIGENSLLKSSLLFQAALSVASVGDLVIFVCPGPIEPPPYHVAGMTEHSKLHLQCIKIVHLPGPADLLRYLCDFHTKECLPAAIMIDDVQFYVSHLSQEQNEEAAMVKLFAILEDTVAFISHKKGESCHRMVTLSRGACPKKLVKRYFQEIWNASEDETGELMLTDDHIPAFRAHLRLNDSKREIDVDRIHRLAGEGATTSHDT